MPGCLPRAMKSRLQALTDIRRIQTPQLWMKGYPVNFEETIQLQVLKLKAQSSIRGQLLDHVLESDNPPIQVRQMCAKVSTQLYDELESVCGLLDMSKREFIEGAVADAISRAKDVIDRSGVLGS